MGSGDSNEIIESAKAIQETAKASGKALEVAQGLGAFANRVFGGLVEDSVGLVADRLRFYRLRQAVRLREKVEGLLGKRGISRTRPVSPVLALPILEEASIEDDETLHTLWAQLLAAAMDPSRDVQRSFIGILKGLEPFDAEVFRLIAADAVTTPGRHNETIYFRNRIAPHFRVDEERLDVTFHNLIRLGLVSYGVLKNTSAMLGEYPMTIFRGSEEVSVTTLGIAFYRSVMNE